MPPEHMQPYLDALMNKLLQMLQGGHRMVQESALTALASVADNAQTAFAKYYSTVLPFLKQILVGAAGKEHRMLRAKAMECISLVGMAVGKEQFAPDAREVMDLLMQLQAGGFEDDDTTASYMQQAWTRLCKCLGRDFIQYLQVVMPPLLKSAQLKPDVQVTDAEDAGEEEEEDDVEVIAVGDKRISIRTSVLEERLPRATCSAATSTSSRMDSCRTSSLWWRPWCRSSISTSTRTCARLPWRRSRTSSARVRLPC